MKENEQCPFVVLEVPSDMRVQGKPRFLFANKVPKSTNILFSGDKILHGIQFKEMQEAGMARPSRGRYPYKRFGPPLRGSSGGRFRTYGGGPPGPGYYRPKFMGVYHKPRFGSWNNPRGKPYGYRPFVPRKFDSGRHYNNKPEEGRSRHYSGSSYEEGRRRPPPRGSPVYDNEEDRSAASEDFHSSDNEGYSSPRKSSKSKHKNMKRKSHYEDDSDSRHYDFSRSSRSSSRSYYNSASRSPSRYGSPASKRFSPETPPKRHMSKHSDMKYKSKKNYEKEYSQESLPSESFDKDADHYRASYKPSTSSERPSYSSAKPASADRSPQRDYEDRRFDKDYSPEKGKPSSKHYTKKYTPDPPYKNYSPPKKHYQKEEYSPGPGSKSSDEEHYATTRPRHYSGGRYPGGYKEAKYFTPGSHYKHYEKRGGKYAPSYDRDFPPKRESSYSPYGEGGSSKSKYYDNRRTPPKYHPPLSDRPKKRGYSPSSDDHAYPRKSRDDQKMWVQKMLSKLGNLKPFVNPVKTKQVVFLDIQAYPSFFHELQGQLLPKGTFVCLFHGVVRGSIVPTGCPAVEALQQAECFFSHPDCNSPRGLALETLPPVALLLHTKLPASIPFFLLSKISFHTVVQFMKQSREVHFIPMDRNAMPRLLHYLH